MSESFEAGLIAASSKEAFKKAKQILKNGELLCCLDNGDGRLRAICRDSAGVILRVEFQGFPRGPFQASCSCGSETPGFCAHAMAAALYHAKYTIKYKESDPVKELPAQYAGLKFSGLPELLTQVLEPQTSYVEIEAESEFPHVPSKWERVPLSVSLKTERREYFGNLNNLRQLHFGKSLAATLQLNTFPEQDRQIIRYLAINAQQDGSKLSLDAEQCAEFFHSLIGFSRFKRLGESVVVHREPATPILLLEKVKSGYLLRSSIVVRGAPLPLSDVKVITGRTGCWIGMLGEYWWIPAQTDVAWLRGFLRTTIQPCDAKAAQLLLDARETLPVRVVPSNGVKVRQRKFKTLYDGVLTPDGTLELELYFDYDGRLCKADQLRLASAPGGNFWRRNTKGEFDTVRELVNFGFKEVDTTGKKDSSVRLVLTEREAIGMFVDEVVPKWLREKRECLLSSGLTALLGNAGNLRIGVEIVDRDDASYVLAVSLTAGGAPVRWKPLAEAAARNEFFLSPFGVGSFVKIPPELRVLAAAMEPVAVLLPPSDARPDADMIRLPRSAALYWATAGASLPGAVPLEFLRLKVDYDLLQEQLVSGVEPPLLTDRFHGELRGYQKAGVFWLDSMIGRGYNLILADEMGLGKTIQTLAALCAHSDRMLPAMIVCPTTLVDNWRREAARFTPDFRLCVIEGHDRKALWANVPSCDLCICSYALLKRDAEQASALAFHSLILDEAQHIKNPASINAQTCKMIRAAHKLVLTGTPLENSAEDLWSIFDFLHPGLLGSLSGFRAKYANLSFVPELKQELSRRIAPFILRRKKAEVCADLPSKQEQVLCCDMQNGQRALYEQFSREALEQCRRAKDGGNVSRMDILALLMRLRQICCDPALLPAELLPPDESAPASAKMELFQEVLLESIDSGHKVLVFSQFTSLLKIIRVWLEREGMAYEYLDGATRDRMEHVDHFNNSPDIPVFLLSLKAGGLGLNLTSADTVIICDPWWNPAAEDQAADRTHRIGQTRKVNCVKLVVKDSIEEKVLELQQKKKELFGALVEDSAAAMSGFTLDDFEFLLKSDSASGQTTRPEIWTAPN